MEDYNSSNTIFLLKQHNNIMRSLKTQVSLAILKINKSSAKNTNKERVIFFIINNLKNKIFKQKQQLRKKIEILNELYKKTNKISNNIVRQKKRALIVGINYLHSPFQLYGCMNDAKHMADFALNRGFKTVVTLTDKTSTKPTQTKILEYFKMLLSNNKHDDNPNTYLFFCSSHGAVVKDKNGDETTGFDETIVPIDYNFNESKLITDDKLREIILSTLKPNDTLVGIFDSCHSATIFDTMYTYLDSTNNNNNSMNPLNATKPRNGQVITISGCTDLETSADAFIDGENCGAFTNAFLKVIQKFQNTSISWRTLINNIRETLKNNGFSQVPQLSSYKYLDIDSNICF